ncbi:hypothetical protein [Lysobacter gummosus]
MGSWYRRGPAVAAGRSLRSGEVFCGRDSVPMLFDQIARSWKGLAT